MVTTANELERIFNQVESQFRATDSAADFPRFRKAMFGIAKETGEAVDSVANVGYQFKGAFGATDVAIAQTSAAIKVARVTGLSITEVVDSLTAASKSFGVSIEAVGDEAVGLQDRFAVLAKETIKVFGDLGPAAKEAGLSLEEVGALLGPLQQASARTGASMAENLGRVLPSIQQNAGRILELYQQAVPGKVADIGPMLQAGVTARPAGVAHPGQHGRQGPRL